MSLLLLLLAATAGQPAGTQDLRIIETVRDDFRDAVGDVFHVWTAPLRVDGEDAPSLILAAQAVALTVAFDGEIQQWVRAHTRSLPLRILAPVQEPALLSYLGRTFVLLPLSGALYATGLALDDDALREAGIGCATANVATTLSRHVIGRLTGRLRPMYGGGPYDFEPLAWSDWPRRSFPGGHGANIAACASFWNDRFDLGAAGPALYLFAIALGAARIPTEKHWASDIVFGFILGRGVGRSVAGRFAERDAEDMAARRARSSAEPAFYIGWRVGLR